MSHFITADQKDRQEITEWGQEDGREHHSWYSNLSRETVEKTAEAEAEVRAEDHSMDSREDFLRLYTEGFVDGYFSC